MAPQLCSPRSATRVRCRTAADLGASASALLEQGLSPVVGGTDTLHGASLPAHDDAIWSVAWGTNKKENSETVVTGSLDDLVKVWKWWVPLP